MVLRIITLSYNHHHCLISQYVHLPPQKETLYPLAVTPNPVPWQPLMHFLPIWICLFWTFHVHGIIQHVAFCVCLLLLSIMCSRFVHVVLCISSSSSLWSNNISLYGYMTFYLSIYQLMAIRVASTFWL